MMRLSLLTLVSASTNFKHDNQFTYDQVIKLPTKHLTKREVSDQDGFTLDTSTFTREIDVNGQKKTVQMHKTDLTQAEGHTHAFVNWYHDQAVFILTQRKSTSRYHDQVEESILFKSYNEGKTWESVKYNDLHLESGRTIKEYKPHPRKNSTLLFIVSPKPGLKNYVIVTTDVGRTYQQIEIPFELSSFKIHYKHDDWILAIDDRTGELWVTKDLCQTWTKLTDKTLMKVTKDYWFWGIEGQEAEDVVHFEYRAVEESSYSNIPRFSSYYGFACKIDECPAADIAALSKPVNAIYAKLGKIKKESLVLKDKFILATKADSLSTVYTGVLNF